MHKNNKLNYPYIITQESAQYYECSYCCDHAIVLVCDNQKFFITDGRYSIEAKESVREGVEVLESQDLNKTLCQVIQKEKISSLIFDSLHTSVAMYSKISSLLSRVTLIAKPNFHQELRMIKTDDEIEKIKISQTLNKEAFRKFGEFLQNAEGKSEKELQFLSKSFLTHNGNYDLSFEPIFALNANGAKPHALPMQESIFKQGDFVLFDAGIKYQHYCSDQTRCAFFEDRVAFMEDQKGKNQEFQKIYDIVKEAKDYAIANLRAGMRGKEIDALARGVIEKRGYGQYFMHSTGHGIGLDIHELPRISLTSEEIIDDGMVFSIEPGIYLEGKVGVRLEDLVVIKNGKAEIL